MIVSAISMMLGAAILAAVAHVTALATGGYGDPHSYITVSVAGGVAGGSVFCGMAWSAGRQKLAAFFVVCIVAGELYGFLQPANRLISGIEATQAPLREHQEAYAQAVERVANAKAAVDRLPTTSPRLEKAEAAKKAADTAIVSKAAEKTCAANCRQLLQAQADAAGVAVVAARDALDLDNGKAGIELNAARTALAGMEPPKSPTPLADRTGIPAWIIDLFGAGLGSLAANGLACCLLIFGAHHHPQRRVEVATPQPVDHDQPAQARGVMTVAEAPSTAAPARKSKASRTYKAARGAPTKLEASPVKELAAQFALECLQPSGEADLLAIQNRYLSWDAGRASGARVTPNQMGNALSDLFQGAGIDVAKRGERLVAIGFSLKEESRALVSCKPAIVADSTHNNRS